jgi:hypothetical protein
VEYIIFKQRQHIVRGGGVNPRKGGGGAHEEDGDGEGDGDGRINLIGDGVSWWRYREECSRGRESCTGLERFFLMPRQGKVAWGWMSEHLVLKHGRQTLEELIEISPAPAKFVQRHVCGRFHCRPVTARHGY